MKMEYFWRLIQLQNTFLLKHIINPVGKFNIKMLA